MTPSEIQEQLRSGVTIAQVCHDNEISFGELCQMFHGYMKKGRPLGLPMYVCQTPNNKYMIRRKNTQGKEKYYGTYDTIEDAVKVRNYLIKHGWYQNRVPAIKDKLGIK